MGVRGGGAKTYIICHFFQFLAPNGTNLTNGSNVTNVSNWTNVTNLTNGANRTYGAAHSITWLEKNLILGLVLHF